MDVLTWNIRTSLKDDLPEVYSEYLLNDLGVFVKRERRMPRSNLFTAVTGFRVGYFSVPGADYRVAPIDRDAILWYKVTSIEEVSENSLLVKGNRSSEIVIYYPLDNRDTVLQYIAVMRQNYPVIIQADPVAASWLCWRDDDEWEDPLLPIINMVEEEMQTERFIEPEILEETELMEDSIQKNLSVSDQTENKPKFCVKCGSSLRFGINFCENCGNQIKS